MNISISPLNIDGDELFLVEGNLTELQTARTTVNLLEQVEQRFQAKNLAAGTAAAVSGMYGMLANSAMLALYDGENMHNFAGLLGDQVICGVFEKGDKLKNGDPIKAVVSKRGEVLYAHSVLRTSDHLLLMPLTTFAGKKAFFRGCMKVAWRGSIFLWLFLYTTMFFILQNRAPLEKNTLLGAITMLFFIPPLLLFPTEYWTYRSMGYCGKRASAIFKVYGFPRPDDLDVRSGMTHYPDHSYGYGGINCDLALKNHKAKFGIKE